MTLSKLSARNAKRQTKDYLVYFVTVVMAAALLYSFNGLVFSQEISTLSNSISTLPLMIVLASVVVVCVFGWLVSYATRFMLLRRGRELGTYLLIGLENRQVARLFFLENLAVGGCALVLGTALGGLFYQAFRAIVLALFGLLLYRLMFIAQNAPDMYGSLIVTGIFAHVALQVVLNVAVVINLIPTTGITLPFISYGGSSVMFLLIEIGLVLSVARRIQLKELA